MPTRDLSGVRELGTPGVRQATEAALGGVQTATLLSIAVASAQDVSTGTGTSRPLAPRVPLTLTKLLGRSGLTRALLLLGSPLHSSASAGSTSAAAASASSTPPATVTAASTSIAATEAPTSTTTPTPTPSSSSTATTAAPTTSSSSLAPLALADAAPLARSRCSTDRIGANKVDSSSRGNRGQKRNKGAPLKERGTGVTTRGAYSGNTSLGCKEALLEEVDSEGGSATTATTAAAAAAAAATATTATTAIATAVSSTATATATTATAAPACCTTMASLRVLAFDHEGRPIQFDTWLDNLQLTAQALYDAIVTRYSSTATAALGRLLLPYLFPELSAFATVEDLVSHLCTSDARYRATVPAEFLDRNPPPMFITLYFIVTRLPDSFRSVKDHIHSLDSTSLTVELLEEHLLAAETSAVAVGAARGTLRTPFFEGCSPSPLAPSYASAAAGADVPGAEDVRFASTSANRCSSKGKGGKGGGGGSGSGGGGSGGGSGGGGGGGGGGTGGGGGGSCGGGGGSGGSGCSGGGGTGGGRTGARRGGSGGGQRQQQQRRSETQSTQLRALLFQRGTSGGSDSCPYVIRTSHRAGQTCGRLHTQHRGFFRLDVAWRAEFGDKVERPHWEDLLRTGVAIFDLDCDVILFDMYALSVSAEGDCYRCVPPDPGIAAAALRASESGTLPGSTPTEALHTFILDSGASRCFFRDSTTLTPLSTPVPVRLSNPSGGPVVARSSTVLSCLSVPSGPLSACVEMHVYTDGSSPGHVHSSARVEFVHTGYRDCSCRLLLHNRLRGMHSRLLVSGLPRSLPPLMPSLAPPCLPCIEGWQHAAPHSSFPPTTAPLRTLHVDVWGPACVSGEGRELYFRLVVDDYTRYATVFPLRSKGQSFTLLDSPQQNGIAGRRIGLVMEVARTSMIHAAAPNFLWPFGVWYAAHQLNLWPRVSLPETSPILCWTGKVGDASVFQVRGSRASVRNTSADKLSARAIPCVFLRIVPDAPGWQFYHPTSRRVLPSQDVTPPPVDPLPPQGPAPLGVSQVDPPLGAVPGEVAVDSGAAKGTASRGAEPGGAEPGGVETGGAAPGGSDTGGAETGGAEPGGAEPEGVEPGGAESEGAESGGAGPQGAAFSGGGAVAAGARGAGTGVPGGTAAIGPGGARTRGTEATGTGGVGGAGAGDPTESGAAGAGGSGVGGTGAGGARVGGAGSGGAGVGGTGAGGAGAGGAGALDPDYATTLVAESASASPPSVGGECALGTDVFEDRQEDFECLAAAVPRFASMLLAPEGDPDAPDIPTTRSYAEAITGSPPGANIVDGMWIFRVKRPSGSPHAFKARYVARGFSQQQGVDYFHNFSPTTKMTTLRVLLHVAAQRDYELHSLDFSTTFLQGSLHEEIWLRRSLGRFMQWHDSLRTTPTTADPSLFLRTDMSLPPFYVLVYVDDLVFAIVDTEALTLVKSELRKRHTCTDLGELRSYFGLQITRDRARRTISLTQSHMVHQVLQRFGFQFSSPQPTPLSTSHSLSAPPSDESVEPSGLYPKLVGCLMYLMTCTRPDLAYPLSLLARYVAPVRHRKVHWDAAKRVLRYLCSTSSMGLVLGGRSPVVLTRHAHAFCVDDSATQRLSEGYTFSLGSGSVSWRSTRSSSVLSSSCKAEIYAGAMAAQ
ncbi:unnamed protein product [Closterium sp. NIES-53]